MRSVHELSIVVDGFEEATGLVQIAGADLQSDVASGGAAAGDGMALPDVPGAVRVAGVDVVLGQHGQPGCQMLPVVHGAPQLGEEGCALAGLHSVEVHVDLSLDRIGAVLVVERGGTCFCDGGRVVAGQPERLAAMDLQAGRGGPGLLREPVAGVEERLMPSFGDPRIAEPFQQSDGPQVVARFEGVEQCLFERSGALEVVGGALVGEASSLVVALGEQEVAEEVVVAVAAASVVHAEESGGEDLLQGLGRVGASAQVRGEGLVEGAGRGGVQEEGRQVGGEPGQDLFAEVGEERLTAGGQLLGKYVDVGSVVAQVSADQTEGDGPALGLADQKRGLLRADFDPEPRLPEVRGFLRGEREVAASDDARCSCDLPAGEIGQGGPDACGDEDVEPWGEAVDKAVEDAVDRGCVGLVVVVEDEEQTRAGDCLQLGQDQLHQLGPAGLGACRAGLAAGEPPGKCRAEGLQGPGQAGEEDGRVAVVGAQGVPGAGKVRGRRLGESGFAVSGLGLHDGQRVGEGPVEQGVQARSRGDPGSGVRGAQATALDG